VLLHPTDHSSYFLSVLQEASIADISYLFEEGALVDFEVEELVKLVRALFADTPLRTTTVNRLMGGHPVHQRNR
jgi:protein transport protein DSL1/ZW10